MSTPAFDAIVLALSPHARRRVFGLTLAERGAKVALKLGARRVHVVDSPEAARELPRWVLPDIGVLVIQAGDQVVHPPLAEALVADGYDGPRHRIAVGPDGQYAGALWATVGLEVAQILASAPDDRALAASWTDADRRVHGEIARHPATTAAERAGAKRMLVQLVLKSEDGPVTKYIYRPVSVPLTRVLLHTPITPNQVSILVFLMGMVGCWLTLQPSRGPLVGGALLVLAAGFLDGCDGEIARLRLLSSKFGAWLDTVVDELTTTVYLVCIGIHTYRRIPESWVVPSLVVSLVCYVASIYVIYYFLIVVSKTGNSQHYLGRLDIVDDPQRGLGLRARPVAPSAAPPWVRTLGVAAMQIIRRDFINLAAVVLCALDLYWLVYGTMALGGVATAIVVVPEHLRLRGQLRELARRGGTAQLLPAA